MIRKQVLSILAVLASVLVLSCGDSLFNDVYDETSRYRVYAVGDFTGMGGETRYNFAEFDGPTGALTSMDLGFGTNLNLRNPYRSGNLLYMIGTQYTAVVDLSLGIGSYVTHTPAGYGSGISDGWFDDDYIYICGSFTSLNGVARECAATFDRKTGIITPFNPPTITGAGTPYIGKILLYGDAVLVCGDIVTVGGAARSGYAFLDRKTGALLPNLFTLSANSNVYTIVYDGDLVYIGGSFTTVSGVGRTNAACLDRKTGLVTPWNPSPNNPVRTIVPAEKTIFLGGEFTLIGTESRSYAAEVDRVVGFPTAWDPNCNTTVHTIVPTDDVVYIGGYFNNIGGESRNYLAMVDRQKGKLLPWNSNGSGSMAYGVTGIVIVK
ncbi:MAG: hypothetical protein JXA20_10650 [Spirochaetes bacterium]|nr:hypothetical protein [Spirochaetota bacterium]